MHRRSLHLIVRAVIVAAACAAPAFAQAPAEAGGPAPAAEQRLAELAQRYAGESEATSAQPGTAAATPVTSPVPAAEIEQRPLGASGDGRGAESRSAAPSDGWALSTLAALGVVIGLIFLGRWVYAKLGGRVIARSSPAVEVLSRTSVAPKNQVLLLRIGQRVLVVGDSSSGLRTLANLDDPEEVAALLQTVTTDQDHSVSKTFHSLVSRFNGDYDGKMQLADEGGDVAEHRVDRTRDSLSGLASRLRSLTDRSPRDPRGDVA